MKILVLSVLILLYLMPAVVGDISIYVGRHLGHTKLAPRLAAQLRQVIHSSIWELAALWAATCLVLGVVFLCLLSILTWLIR